MKTRIIVLFFIFCISATFAQKNYSFTFEGYVTNMQSVMFEKFDEAWLNDNLIHNRLNLNYYYKDNLNVSLQMRNRIFTGETVKYTSDYRKSLALDEGL